MTTTPVRYDRLQAGLVAAVRAAIGAGPSIVWAKTGLQRGTAPADLVLLEAIDEPSSGDTFVTAELPMLATVTMTAAGWLRTCGIQIEAADRDAMVEAVTAALPDVTVEAVDADDLTLEAADVGDLYGLAVSDDLDLAIDETAIASVSIDRVTIRVAVDFYTRATAPRLSSRRLARRWVAWLGAPAALALLAAHDLAVSVVSVNQLDGLAGPEHESRTRVAVDVSLPSIWAELVDTVETAAATLEII
jgi:hypothetical protein